MKKYMYVTAEGKDGKNAHMSWPASLYGAYSDAVSLISVPA